MSQANETVILSNQTRELLREANENIRHKLSDIVDPSIASKTIQNKRAHKELVQSSCIVDVTIVKSNGTQQKTFEITNTGKEKALV